MRNTIALICTAFVLYGTTTSLRADNPTDVVSFTAGTSAVYVQDDDGVALDTGSNPYRMNVNVEETEGTSLFSSGVVEFPDSSSQELVYGEDGWDLDVTFATFDELKAGIAAGTYTLTMSDSESATTVVEFSIDPDETPDYPVISNYSSLQNFDATLEQTVTWGAWTAGTTDDYIMIELEDQSGDIIFSISPEDTGALDGTATSATIPADTMTAGSTYTLSVFFLNIISAQWSGGVSDFPEALLASFAESKTKLSISANDPNASIFENEESIDDWVIPYNSDITYSFGWVNDMFYPWVYSASLDILNNESYMGDGDGWIYIMPVATLEGFFFYRYDIDDWAWCSYYDYGWIYDFYSSSWVDITP